MMPVTSIAAAAAIQTLESYYTAIVVVAARQTELERFIRLPPKSRSLGCARDDKLEGRYGCFELAG